MTYGLIIFIMFLIMKINNVLEWDWIWVTSPLWICLSIEWASFTIIRFIRSTRISAVESMFGSKEEVKVK